MFNNTKQFFIGVMLPPASIRNPHNANRGSHNDAASLSSVNIQLSTQFSPRFLNVINRLFTLLDYKLRLKLTFTATWNMYELQMKHRGSQVLD